MTAPQADNGSAGRRRSSVRRTAVLLGVVALLVYLGFVFMVGR
ncbi:MAG: hypothetical protein ABFS23_02155 [Pseudomonadota bacterium]